MKIPLKFYEDLRNIINLSDVIRQKVVLTKKSAEYVGLCPFHNEKSPSFTVNDVKRFYHCFGCAAHGDVIKFIANINGFSYKEAAIKLANDYNIELPKLTKDQELLYDETDEILIILNRAMDFFTKNLNYRAINYLKERQIDEKLIKELDIGFAVGDNKLIEFFEKIGINVPKLISAGLVGKRDDGRIYEIFHQRIIFPIKNIYNKVIGFGGRVLTIDMPKYLNSPETIVFKKKNILYGENTALAACFRKNYVILVEGYLDVIALHKTGFKEAVASLGTAVTENQIIKLWKYCDEIILCLDGDEAGLRAINRVINLVLPLINNTKKISFIKLPLDNDPYDIIVQKGAKFFEEMIDNRLSLSVMLWEIEYFDREFATAEDKANLENRLKNYCNNIKDPILNKSFWRYFKDQIWQNLFQIKRKSTAPISNNLKNDIHYSEDYILEISLCIFLLKFPEIMQDEFVKDFYLNLNLKSFELNDFKCWLVEEYENNNDLSAENIIKLIERTRFYDTYLLLLKNDNLLLSIENNNIDKLLLWKILNKKYYLFSLNTEYIDIMQNDVQNNLAQISNYHKEILKVQNEIQELTDSFLNY